MFIRVYLLSLIVFTSSLTIACNLESPPLDFYLSSHMFQVEEESLPASLEWSENLVSVRHLSWFITKRFVPGPDRSALLRTLFFIPYNAFKFQVGRSHLTVIHEVGHNMIALKYGGRSGLGYTSFGTGGEPDLSVEKIFWLYLFEWGYIGKDNPYSWHNVDDITGVSDDEKHRIEAHIQGAGINANNLYALKLRDKILRRDSLHMRDVMDYALNKATAFGYFRLNWGDPVSYLNAVRNQGYVIDQSNVKKMTLGSFLLSGGTLDGILSYWTYLRTGEMLRRPTSFRYKDLNLYLPEFTTYTNPTDVSFSAQFPFRLEGADTLYKVGVERTLYGRKRPTEFRGSFYRPHAKWDTFGELVLNKYFDYLVNAECRYHINSKFDLMAGFTLGDKHTIAQIRELFDRSFVVSAGVVFYLSVD